jgi:ABC-2 type transport system permease protein/lipopolysaccharide transport system permease protein
MLIVHDAGTGGTSASKHPGAAGAPGDRHDIGERVDIASRAEEPPPNIRYRRALELRVAMHEFWQARPVILSLTERDLRSKYSQMVLGFAWSLIAPLALTAVITFVLNRTNLPAPNGIPRPVWIYLALMPWSFFQGAVSNGGTSLVSNAQLLNKVYAPREVFPIAQILEQVVDSTTSSIAFFALLIGFGVVPAATSFWVPIPLLIALIFTLAVTILISGLTVYFRDLRQAIPVVLQLGLFVNPIAWDLSTISSEFRPFYVALNPLAGAIDGLRQCVLYGNPPNAGLTIIAAAVASVELVVCYVLFKQMETGFADVA